MDQYIIESKYLNLSNDVIDHFDFTADKIFLFTRQKKLFFIFKFVRKKLSNIYMQKSVNCLNKTNLNTENLKVHKIVNSGQTFILSNKFKFRKIYINKVLCRKAIKKNICFILNKVFVLKKLHTYVETIILRVIGSNSNIFRAWINNS